MKRIIAIFLALLAIGAFASAQDRAPLQIYCNVSGAQVYLAGQLIGNTNPNLFLNVRMGTYSLTVAKPGFMRFDTMVTVGQGGAQVQANLGTPGGGMAPNTIPVPNNIPAPPPPPQIFNYGLTVSSNVNGAMVFINGNQAGQTPLTAQVPAGSYTVLVRAPGFLDFNQNVVVGNGPAQVNAFLQSMIATWQLVLPDNVRNRDFRPEQFREGIQIWIDGARQDTAPGPIIASGQLTPGRHVIRLVAGGLSSETQIDVQAGQALNLVPFIGVNVQ